MEPVTQPTLADVKTAIGESNRLFEEFKKTNDERIKQLEARGVVDPLITEKLEKLNTAIDAQSKINEDFIATRAAVNKLELAGQLPTGTEGEKRAQNLKKFNRSVRAMRASRQLPVVADIDQASYDAYVAAEESYFRRGKENLSDAEKKALQVGVDSDGGYLVSPDTTGRMVVRLYETSPMRQYAAVQSISTDALEGAADLDEGTFGWVGETASRPETSTPQVPAPWRIPVHEAYAAPRATQKMLEDAEVDVQGWLARKIGDKFGRGFNAAFVNGNGVAKPRGFASYATAATADASRAWGVFEHVATAQNGSFGTDPAGIQKLIALIHKLKDGYEVRAAWYTNRLTLGGMRLLTDASSAGKYVFIPSFQAGMPDTFLGYPVRRLQDMADYTTTDSLAVAFGDMEETYQIVDRLNPTTLVDPYTAKPYVVFYTRARIGGDALNFESLKFLKFGS